MCYWRVANQVTVSIYLNKGNTSFSVEKINFFFQNRIYGTNEKSRILGKGFISVCSEKPYLFDVSGLVLAVYNRKM